MHYKTQRFWRCYGALPGYAQQTADECYQLLKITPCISKKVGKGYWSVRIGLKY